MTEKHLIPDADFGVSPCFADYFGQSTRDATVQKVSLDQWGGFFLYAASIYSVVGK